MHWNTGRIPWNKGLKGFGKGKKLGADNGMWKGDQVKYGSLHDYIKSHFPKTKLCQRCNKKPSYDLSNISGKYKRDLTDWEWICRKCHMEKDGRMGNFIKKRVLLDRNCSTCGKTFRPSKATVEFCSRKCRPISNWKGGISLDNKEYQRMRYQLKKDIEI